MIRKPLLLPSNHDDGHGSKYSYGGLNTAQEEPGVGGGGGQGATASGSRGGGDATSGKSYTQQQQQQQQQDTSSIMALSVCQTAHAWTRCCCHVIVAIILCNICVVVLAALLELTWEASPVMVRLAAKIVCYAAAACTAAMWQTWYRQQEDPRIIVGTIPKFMILDTDPKCLGFLAGLVTFELAVVPAWVALSMRIIPQDLEHVNDKVNQMFGEASLPLQVVLVVVTVVIVLVCVGTIFVVLTYVGMSLLSIYAYLAWRLLKQWDVLKIKLNQVENETTLTVWLLSKEARQCLWRLVLVCGLPIVLGLTTTKCRQWTGGDSSLCTVSTLLDMMIIPLIGLLSILWLAFVYLLKGERLQKIKANDEETAKCLAKAAN